MFDIFMYAANAILPIILLIFIGFFVRKLKLVDRSFFQKSNVLVFRLFLPVMVFFSIYNGPDIHDINWALIIFAYIVILFLFFLGIVVSHFFVKERESRGVIVQCSFRSNFAIIGLPLTAALGSSGGTSIASIMLAFLIPLFNVLAVVSLTMYQPQSNNSHRFRSVFINILKNPLIIGCVSGLLALVIRSFIPLDQDGVLVFSIQNDLPFIYDTLKSIDKATTAIALITLGGLLDFSSIHGKLKNICIGTAMRTVIAPLIGLSAAVFVSQRGIIPLGPSEYASLIALFGSPVAVASAIMAAEMNSDAELARQLVVWTSIVPIITTFTIVVIFRSLGFI